MGFLSKLFALFRSHDSSWGIWDDSVHQTEGQPGRMQRALTQNLKISEKNQRGQYLVTGSKGNIYRVNFDSCTCEDFKRRGLPCKHMYALAMKEAGFNPIPYVIKIEMVAHPLRGFMNMGRFKVKGKSPATNRFNTKTVYALDESNAISAGRLAGLADPVTATEVEFEPATEKSLAVAASQGVYIPTGAKEADVLASIARYEAWNETTIAKCQWEYAASCGVPLSALAGEASGKAEFRKIHKRWLSEEKLVNNYDA